MVVGVSICEGICGWLLCHVQCQCCCTYQWHQQTFMKEFAGNFYAMVGVDVAVHINGEKRCAIAGSLLGDLLSKFLIRMSAFFTYTL